MNREIDKFAHRGRADLFRAFACDEPADALFRLAPGDDLPVAVRSSATTEDLPEACFAGQQDTCLWAAGARLIWWRRSGPAGPRPDGVSLCGEPQLLY